MLYIILFDYFITVILDPWIRTSLSEFGLPGSRAPDSHWKRAVPDYDRKWESLSSGAWTPGSLGATVDLHSQIPGLGPGSQNPWTPGPGPRLPELQIFGFPGARTPGSTGARTPPEARKIGFVCTACTLNGRENVQMCTLFHALLIR